MESAEAQPGDFDPDDGLRLYFAERLERLVARRRAAASAGLKGVLPAYDRAICSTYQDCVALGAPDDRAEIMRLIARFLHR